MRVEIFFPPKAILCVFGPLVNVPYSLVHTGASTVFFPSGAYFA